MVWPRHFWQTCWTWPENIWDQTLKENFQYLSVVCPKFITVQSDMQDQDYGMNYHNIYKVQIH